jgi:hypothetical protein
MTSVFEPLVADLRAIFAGRLRSVAIYGRHVDSAPPPRGTPVHAIALVSGTIGMDDLEGCARQAPRWTRDGFAIPLVLGEQEFARSLDAFPVEFGAILAQHTVVFGADPFVGLSVRDEDLRRACEVEAKGHLLHLREGFIEAGGSPRAQAAIIEASAAPLRSLLANITRLEGIAATQPSALATHMTTRLGPVHGRTIGSVLALAESPLGDNDAARLFPSYLAAAEALASYVDGWSR